MKWLVGASASDVATLRVVLDALHPAKVEPDYAGDAYRGVMRRRRQAKREAKRPKKKAARKLKRRSYDAFQPNATHSAKAWETLKGSTGALSAKEIGELIGVPAQRASSIMCALYNGRHGRVIERTKSKAARGDGSVAWSWLYRHAPRNGVSP